MPRGTYIAGLDVLGMAPVVKPKIVTRAAPVAVKPGAKPAAVAKPAASTAKPAAKPAVVSAAVKKSTQVRAAASARHANSTADKLAQRKAAVAKNMSKTLKTHASNLTKRATMIKGVAEIVGDDTAVDDVTQAAGNVDYMAQAGDIANQLLTTIDKLYAAGKSDLAHEGESMVDAANYIIVTLDQMLRSNAAM